MEKQTGNKSIHPEQNTAARIILNIFLFAMPLFCIGQNSLYIAPGGVKKWVNLGDLDVPGNQLTVEALMTWVGNGGLNIVSKHLDPGNVNYLLRPKQFLITTDNGFFALANPLFTPSIPVNQAYHIAATYDGAELRYYVNGCLVNSTPCTGNMIQNDLNTAIGNQSTNPEAFNGYIDEVRIWNVARTQAEIQANMNTLPSPATQAGLLAYYDFNSDFTNIQGNATWDGIPVGPPVLAANPYWTGSINNLSVTATGTDNSCFGDTSGAITASATGAFSPYTFSLDGTNYGSPFFTGLISGTYIVYAKTNASCIDTVTVFIDQPTPLSISAIQVFAPCDSVATGVAGASGGTGSSYSYQWSSTPVQNTDTAIGLVAGTYTIYATDSNNCLDSNTFDITITEPLSLSLSMIFPPCPGECNGSAAALGSGGNGTLSYLWEDGLTTQLTAILCADTVDVSLSDTNGCSFTDTLVVLEAGPILTTIDTVNSNCGQPDGSASVSVLSGGAFPGTYFFQWDSAAGNQVTSTATGLIDGIYSVKVSSGLCDTIIYAEVGFNAPPVASATGDSALCFGNCNGTGTITAVGGPGPGTYSYLWDNGETTQTATGLCMGTHAVTATDPTGCSAITSLIIYQPDSLINSVEQFYSPCDSFASASATTIGGTGAYSYQWSTNPIQTSDSATGLISGTYTVITMDENNCSDSDTIFVTITEALTLSFSMIDPPCPGECNGSASAAGTGGTPPLSYFWEDGQEGLIADSLCTGIFNVSVVDSNSCVLTDTINLLQAQPIANIISSVNSNCGQPDGSASVSGLSGGGIPGNYSYLWDTAAASQTTTTATGLSNGIYLVTITSGFCDTVVAASVGFNDPPTATADGDSTRCFNECNGTGTVTAVGGPAPVFTYLWENGETGQTATALCADSHSVTVTDAVGCTATASLIIYQPDLLSASVSGDGDTIICTSGTATISGAGIGGTVPYAFVWNNGWIGPGPHSDTPTDSTCYSFSITDSKGCDTSSSFYCVGIFPPIQVSSQSNDTICEGRTITIGAGAAGGHPDSLISFTWSNGLAGDTIAVTPATYPLPATYTVVASDGCSPDASTVVTINHFITPAVSFTSDTNAGCMPLTINFQNTTPNSFSQQWTFGDGNTSASLNPNNIFQDTGSYHVSLNVISTDGCPGDTVIYNYIKVNPLPPANAGNDTTVYQESTVLLTATGGIEYLWDNGEDTSTISVIPPQTTTYFVTVTDAAGCVSFGDVTITVDFKYVIFIPSIFSPNKDDNNDILYVQGLGIANFRLQVFNRWGEKVFETMDEKTGWDGKSGGNELNTGVFVYYLQATMDNGEVVKRSGNITLVK